MDLSRKAGSAALSCLAAASLVLTAACGGSESTGNSATSKLKGTPVKVMVWAPEDTAGSSQPGVRLTAQAYADWLNGHGGLNGGPLELVTCNEKNNADQAEKCARRAVSEHAVAVVGSYSLYGDRYMPILQKAGIPYIGGTGVSAAEFSNPLSFPVNGGTPTVFTAHGRQLAQAGCKSVSNVIYDLAAGAVVSKFLTLGLTSAGGHPPKVVKVPVSATDLAPQAAAATKGNACVSVNLGTASALFIKSYVQSGAKSKLGSVAGSLTPQLAASSGGVLEGATITAYYPPPSDPAWKNLAAAAKGKKGINVADGAVQTTWVAFTAFTAAAKKIDKVTPQALAKELNSATALETGGLTPPLNWLPANALKIKGLERIHNVTATELTMRNGEFTWAKPGSTFVDVRPVFAHLPAH